MPHAKKFAAAMQPRIMADRYFLHSEAGLLEFPGHLYTDHTATRFQFDVFEYLTAEQAEVAIDIADGEMKCPPHHAPVSCADPNAVPRIGTSDLEAIDEIDIRTELGEQIMHFANVVLAVAVRVEDQVLACV